MFSEIGWQSVAINPVFLTPSSDKTLLLQSNNSSGTTDFNHPWVFVGSSNQDIDPGDGNANRRGQNNVLRISTDDRLAVDRTAELNSVTPGTIIRYVDEGDLNAFIEYEVIAITDNTTWFQYDVILTNIGSSGEPGVSNNIQIYFEVPVAALTDYVSITNHFLGATGVQGAIQLGDTGIAYNDNAYGFDVELQYYTQSDDWRILSFPSDSSGGGSTTPGGDADISDTLLFSNDGTLSGMTTTNDTTNVWISTTADSIEGSNSLCISNNAVNSQYDVDTANTSHIETDSFAISADADNVWVNLTSWLGIGESAPAVSVNSFDFARCFIAFDSFTPVAGTLPSSGASIDFIGILKLQNNPNIRQALFFLNKTKLAKYKGSNCKIIISWTNDVAVGLSPGITIGGLEVWEGPAIKIPAIHTEVFLDFANINVNSGVNTKIAYNVIIDDRQHNWDYNDDRFIAPEDGLYSVGISEEIQLNAAGLGILKLYKNGSHYPISESDRTEITSSVFPSVTTLIHLKEGDYLEAFTFQGSGFAASVLPTGNSRMTITKMK